ncbi:ATP-dependent DNA helicase [Demequina capsici]|uniref:DNA 5'-3' helicase n=1 Tax=Demequina capsici TaxID=3075620 RepID=A0AA96JC62_9MICO|nr:ATP-dependent DNA helicase [Demequina sp. OYTSA14]WNM23369.1 ATP-dependent DNA helicase [Demequina sp. OYTSA14]
MTAASGGSGAATALDDPFEIRELLEAAVAALSGRPREGQQRMAAVVAKALHDGEHALVQAGTGTGKSLGYLVPAVAHAARAKQRIVVSTATLALQRQVYTKDLPMVLDALEPVLGTRPKAALFKGRSNYLCVHRLGGGYPEPEEARLFEAGPTSELGREVARLHEWAESTDTGDRDDLIPGVSGRAWAQVSVSGRECLDSKCPMAAECFSQRARAEAAEAQIIVTNHAVLGVQAASHDLLGEHDVLIVDEAHELVQRITSAATHELTVRGLDRAASSVRRCGRTTDDLDRAARALDSALGDQEVGRLRLGLPEELAAAVELVRGAARALLTEVAKVAEQAGASAKVASAALTEIIDVCEELQGEHGRYVIWLAPPDGEYDERRPARIVAAPLDVAGLIGHRLVEDKAAIFTSATLALGGGFDAISRHMGIADPVTLDAGSPFDYGRQGILYVASHLPRPGAGGISDEALEELVALVEAAGGRTLGLFSSHRAAQAATDALRERLDLPILNQKDDQLPTLVRQFADDPRACLFGSTSLWQGIDVPGPTASLVVIDRIPFPRPDDPVAQARTEAVAQGGGNGFMAVSATHAALLMAQGAGRLIRAMEDRGVVAVLDSRLSTARYGGFLARSMPPLWGTTDRDAVLGALRRLDDAACADGR